MEVHSWVVEHPAAPMRWLPREESPGSGEVLIAVAGCGVCHTDLGFYFDGVPTRQPFPLTLGHEVSGTVLACGPGAEDWQGETVIVPAVLPCGVCAACLAGRGSICPHQVFPGSDLHGGFGSHLRVPAQGLCRVPDLSDPAVNPAGLALADLAVIADAVTTPYQAILKSGLAEGDLAVFVGAGGVGGFGVQIAAAFGARTIAIDLDPARLAQLSGYGASLTLCSAALDPKAIRQHVRAFAREHDIPSWRTFIFETSGAAAGQELAFALLDYGSTLLVVGYTAAKISIRLSNLMAFDAAAIGTWGCLPQHYPAVRDLALQGKVQLAPFVGYHPLAQIHDIFAALHDRTLGHRAILIPGA